MAIHYSSIKALEDELQYVSFTGARATVSSVTVGLSFA